MKKVAWYGLLSLIAISLLGCVWDIFNVYRKTRTRLDLLSTPQPGGENVMIMCFAFDNPVFKEKSERT